MAATVDIRGAQRKLQIVRKALSRADQRAKRDAGRQTRTQAKREVAKAINLKGSDIARDMRIEASGETVAFHVVYRQKPAHHFKGWKYRGVAGGIGVTEHGGRRLTFTTRKVTKAWETQTGLRVTFLKSEGPMVFNWAFRTPKVGGGRVFIQRKGRARKPLEAIRGPTPHGFAFDNLARLADHGKAAYERRATYWKRRELARALNLRS